MEPRDAGAIDLTAVAPRSAKIAIPRADQLRFFGDALAEAAHVANLQTLSGLGFELVEIDFEPFSEGGETGVPVRHGGGSGWSITARSSPTVGGRPPRGRASIVPGLAYSAQDAFEGAIRIKALKRHAEITL